ncbi:hypothetical protein B296_00000255 [Ensete ventricosum]|uniref:Uncharacterized protein n=1 Tax=Ensete ventricosum TaxID=4639 RepID=A0A427B397_ENSVE|nr:hypothetical protein B296_00000255 [Ensete ventricosum]
MVLRLCRYCVFGKESPRPGHCDPLCGEAPLLLKLRDFPSQEVIAIRRRLQVAASAMAWLTSFGTRFGFAWVSTIFEISRCARARIASCPSPSAFASSPDGPAAAASPALSGCIDTIPFPNAGCERLQEAATNRAREREMIQ